MIALPRNTQLRKHPLRINEAEAETVRTLYAVLSKNTNELKTGAPGRFDRVVSKNTNELKTGAPGRRRVSSIIMMESAAIKGLATRLCFWTRRGWPCSCSESAHVFRERRLVVRAYAVGCAFYLFIRAHRT